MNTTLTQATAPKTDTVPPSTPTEPILALLLGCAVFYAAFGFAILNPAHIDWLMHGDPAQHYFGWAFFRQEDWGWPPGLLTGLAAPLQTSIVFTDSIPLLALPLKAFSPLLPSTFQYFGLWILCSYLLLALFAWRLLVRLIPAPSASTLRLMGVLLILLSPPLLLRGYGHEALMAHWLILAAIEQTLQPHRSRRWALWLGIALLTHAYLVVMVAAFWFTSLIHALMIRLGYTLKCRSGLAREKLPAEDFAGKPAPTAMPFLLKDESIIQPSSSLRKLLIDSALLWAGLLALAWLAGYVVPGSSQLVAQGYGHYSANLLTYFDPMDWQAFLDTFQRSDPSAAEWSRLLPPLGHAHHDQYEGFAYLGAGGILALGAALALMLLRPGSAAPDDDRPRLAPALLMAAALFVLSLSTSITLGKHVLFSYSLPAPLQHLLEIFRASGRFAWPLYYLMLILSVAAIANRLRPRYALPLLGLIIGLQAYDLAPKFAEFHQRHRQTPIQFSAAPPALEPLLKNAARLIVLPRPQGDDYLPWVQLALAHGLSLNLGIIARADETTLRAHDEAILRTLNTNQELLPPHSVIVLTDASIPVASGFDVQLIDAPPGRPAARWRVIRTR